MDEVCYEKLLEQAGRNQTPVFVYSRKETAKTARFVRDMATGKEQITQYVRAVAATPEILEQEAQDLLPFGIAIHHASTR